ncbi:hypothetical protein AB1Y20_001155 [Prymnesium parvum]|uniref:Uncharacterized protein n=1 Tax=Prymnesium parvum TaxID=97485 RepID=A0AB34K7X8_PRYPA
MAGVLVGRLVAALESLECGSALPLAPPAEEAEKAGKDLRQLLQLGCTDGCTAQQAQLAQRTIAALLSTPSHAQCICRALDVATRTIAQIDAASDVDTAEAGLMRWGHLRVNLLAVLLHSASSEERSVQLVQWTEGEGARGAAAACLELIDSAAARVDRDGVSFAANVLRNLSMPPANRACIGGLTTSRGGLDPLRCIERALAHAEPASACLLAASARLLVEGCAHNSRRYLAASGGGGPFASLLALDMAHVHPHARVELARFACHVIVAARTPREPGGSLCVPEDVRAVLLDARVLNMGPCFLLSSNHKGLHVEALDALRVARALSTDSAPWPGSLLYVMKNGEPPLSLIAILERLVETGGLTKEEAEPFL